MPFCRAHTTAVDDRTPRAARESLSHVLGVRSRCGPRRFAAVTFALHRLFHSNCAEHKFEYNAFSYFRDTGVPASGLLRGFAPGTAAGVRSIKLLNRVSEH